MTNDKLRMTNKFLTNVRYSVGMYLLLFVFCSVVNAQKRISPDEYIDQYKEIAIKKMKQNGIPASITLAQGMLESNNGNSSLAIKANNHFGIKCHKTWNGKTYYQDDDAKDECFRKYKNAEDSYNDHTEFLTSGSRYSFLFEYKSNDYKSWAKGLKKAGYATNRQYAELLIDIIEKYELYRFDDGDISYKPVKKEKTKQIKEETISIAKTRKILLNNNVEYVLAKEGESLAVIAQEFDKMRWELPLYNNIEASNKLSEGQMVYLQPKKRKAAIGNEFHIAAKNQSMLYISQKYGVKLSRLYRLNRMDKNSEPTDGQKIWLRSRKPITND